MSAGKLILSAAVFLLLTAAIFWYQFHHIESGAARPVWDRHRWVYLLLHRKENFYGAEESY